MTENPTPQVPKRNSTLLLVSGILSIIFGAFGVAIGLLSAVIGGVIGAGNVMAGGAVSVSNSNSASAAMNGLMIGFVMIIIGGMLISRSRKN